MMEESKINNELQQLEINEEKNIHKATVIRTGENSYTIDGKLFNTDDAIKAIKSSSRQVAILKKPYSSATYKIYQIHNKQDVSKIMTIAKENNMYMYYADVVNIDGKDYTGYPHVIEWDSVPGLSSATQNTTANGGRYQCPFCNKISTSTPGRTLHVKSKHPEKYEEYLKQE